MYFPGNYTWKKYTIPSDYTRKYYLPGWIILKIHGNADVKLLFHVWSAVVTIQKAN